MDDEYGDGADLLEAFATSEAAATTAAAPSRQQSRPDQQPPRKIQQPVPQKLDKPPPPRPPQQQQQQQQQGSSSSSGPGSKIVQPTPRALPSRGAGSSILVSPRQKGNPVLACLRSVPWEYSDIPADYGLGATTCALFLSLKYHRLHPEYIYTRIRNLQGRYQLRVLLTIVDITNHEDSLRELAKTSLVNNVTVMLCWSAAECARYLELYKSLEHASGFAAIRGQQATTYAERLVEFVTVPRSVNKADAVSLVSAFGSLRSAVNAHPDQVAVIGGWGERKVKAWCRAVEEPFRISKASRRGLPGTQQGRRGRGNEEGAAGTGGSQAPPNPARSRTSVLQDATPIGTVPSRAAVANKSSGASQAGSSTGGKQQQQRANTSQLPSYDADMEDDNEEAMVAAAIQASLKDAPPARPAEDQLSDGIAAALARLREKG